MIFEGNKWKAEESTVPTRCTKQFTCIFIFKNKNFIFDITISEGSTGKNAVTTAPTRCLTHLASIFIFRSKHFFSIFRFLNVAQERQTCQRHQRGAHNSYEYFYFSVETFFFNISNFEGGTGKADVSTATTWCPQQLRAYLFFDQKIFFNISISEGGTGEAEVSTIPTRCPQHFTSIFIFRSKIFSLSRFLKLVQKKQQLFSRCHLQISRY